MSCQRYRMHAGAQLSAEWLSTGQRRALGQQLDALWREQGLGGPICFSWIDWLQHDVLPFLGITERLLLTFTSHDPALVEDCHERAAAEAPRVPVPAERVQPDSGALASDKAAAGIEQDEWQASQQLAGPASASQGGGACLQRSQMNRGSHQAPDRQQTQRPHFQDNGSLTEAKAPQREHRGRQTADDCAAEQSSTGQLGRWKHKSRSQSNHGTSLNPMAHAWRPNGVQSCLQSGAHAASDRGQGPGRLQAQQSPDRAAVPAGEQRMQTLQPGQPVSGAGTAKLKSSASATGMAEAAQPLPASSHLGELKEPVPAPSTPREFSGHGRAGSRATSSEPPLDSSSDMEQVAKLFTRLAAYSKMRDRELYKEVRQYVRMVDNLSCLIILILLVSIHDSWKSAY